MRLQQAALLIYDKCARPEVGGWGAVLRHNEARRGTMTRTKPLPMTMRMTMATGDGNDNERSALCVIDYTMTIAMRRLAIADCAKHMVERRRQQ